MYNGNYFNYIKKKWNVVTKFAFMFIYGNYPIAVFPKISTHALSFQVFFLAICIA